MTTGELAVQISAKMPTYEDMMRVAKEVEVEMAGLPLNAETAFTYVEKVKSGLADLIEIKVEDRFLPHVDGITSGK